MSFSSWMKASSSRRLLTRQAVVCLGGLAVVSATRGGGSWDPPCRLQEAAAPQHEGHSSNKTLFPDVRPPARKWTSLSSMLWGRPDWPTQYQAFQDALLHGNQYQAMPDPASVMHPSHAIAGALLKEHHIEAYRVFQKTPSSNVTRVSERTDAAAASNDPQVVALVRVGTRVDGHEGIVHGGIVAMLVDDVLGYGFYSIGWPAAFTANLSVNYRQPIPAATILRIECYFERQERRKLYWKIRVVDARKPSVLYVDATSLFVIPKQIYQQVLEKESKNHKSN